MPNTNTHLDEFEVLIKEEGAVVLKKIRTTNPAPASRPALIPTANTSLPTLSPPHALITEPSFLALRERTKTVYDRVTDEIIRTAGISVSAELSPRLRAAIIARLRDVRDSLETADLFQRPRAQGGLGLNPREASQLILIMEKQVRIFSEKLTFIQREKTTTAMTAEKEHQRERTEQRAIDEERARESIYTAITGRAAPVHKKPTEAAAPAPAPAPPQPSRPVVRDVSAPKRSPLVGPVQEISSITLEDFRKLSRDPREAALKIRDKINLLSEQSFGRRHEGLNAWREAEPSRLYRETIAESLERHEPVQAVIARRAAGGRGLTADEFNAIMELNALLRS